MKFYLVVRQFIIYGLLSARNWACIVCALWPADELRECRFPWIFFSSMQYDVLNIKFKLWWADIDDCERTERRLIILMRKNWLIRLCSLLQKLFDKFRSWWLRENWKKVDSIDAKGLIESSLQFFDKFRSWWLQENWRQVDSIDAKDSTESTLQFSTEIQKSLSESLNSNFPAVVISYSCEDSAAVCDKISRAIIKILQF